MNACTFMTRVDWEYVLHERDMVVRKDWFRNADGTSRNSACVLEYPDWVSAFALTRTGKAIFVRQFRNGVHEQALEIPGGWIDAGDASTEAAIRRELLEETGHVFDELVPLVSVSPNPATHSNRLHCFLAMGGVLAAPLQPDADEQIELELLPLSAVKSLLSSGMLLDNGHLTCVFYAMMRLGLLDWTRSPNA
ncbi:NUDIX hydrolase [Paraburkholderia rhizosphaerae]|uniref:GDP-mannose pyrophosphatase n=1 Tax=Paraburkholderia rhizosphaerae TaxID=480658 RepID=A0A4R8LE21_9BURK|nr:NUDIX hydrolase [Paraburkholderia rhizosphaerae]TDY40360.1 NUDIX domain-containing protein [Paraburkholderia rhizosphaerae]